MLQEILLEQDPTGWRMLVGCIMLNQTSRRQVDAVRDDFFRAYPHAGALSITKEPYVAAVLKPLGLYNRRAAILKRFAKWWLEYESVPGFEERIVEMEPPGVGDYARDSWLIFKKGIVPAWPLSDHVLAEFVAQRGGASGVVW
jgi:endonuclease III